MTTGFSRAFGDVQTPENAVVDDRRKRRELKLARGSIADRKSIELCVNGVRQREFLEACSTKFSRLF